MVSILYTSTVAPGGSMSDRYIVRCEQEVQTRHADALKVLLRLHGDVHAAGFFADLETEFRRTCAHYEVMRPHRGIKEVHAIVRIFRALLQQTRASSSQLFRTEIEEVIKNHLTTIKENAEE